jgi:hypothetical protein
MTEPMTRPDPSPDATSAEALPLPCALRLETSADSSAEPWLQRRLVADARLIATGDTERTPTVAHLRALLAWLDGDADTRATLSASHHLTTRDQDLRS